MTTQEHYNVGGVLFARPFKPVRLGHLGLWCKDTLQAEKQLVDVLGLWQTERMTGKQGELLGAFTTCNTDHHALVAINPETADPERRAHYEAGATLNQISFQVNSLREVNDAYFYFQKYGIKVQRIGRDLPGSNWAVYAYDPDGHRVELFYGMEQIGWQGKSKPAAMYKHLPYEAFTLPEQTEVVEVQQARDKGIDLVSGFGKDADLPYTYDVGGVNLQRPFKVSAVGPIRLFVSDLEASERFYTETIGLIRSQVVEYEGHRCVFLRSGLEHHSIALIPIALRETLGMSAETLLMSFGLRVQTYQQLKDSRTHLQQQGLKEIQLPAALNPGMGHVLHFMFDNIHCVQLYCEMAQFAAEVSAVDASWPDQLDGAATTYAAQLRQGPLA